MLIIFSIFILRNVDRIIDEKKSYNYKPLFNPYYKVENNYFKIDNYISCLKKKNKCEQYEFKARKILGRIALVYND